MKVAVFSPYRTVSPHFETELEIIQRHLDGGDSVTLMSCSGELPNCDFNHYRDPQVCQDCAGRRLHGIETVRTAGIRSLDFGSSNRQYPNWPLFANLEALRKLKIGDFEIGVAVISSLVSMVRDPQPDPAVYRKEILRFLNSAWQCYHAAIDLLRRESIDRVYIFNGRFAAMRAVFRAAQSLDIEVCTHERGCDIQHYQLFHNHLPHDIEKLERRMRDHWSGAGDEKHHLAAEWYQGRRDRVERNWHSFVKDQAAGKLPEQWDPRHRNLVFFTSSDDEFVSISDAWKIAIYENQLEGIRRIVDSVTADDESVRFWVRMHPNQGNANNDMTRRMRSMAGRNLVVLPPESRVDTYALVDAAEKVITFGSTVGIEAVWWKRPSVLLSPSFYQSFEGPWRPGNHEQAVSMICQHLQPGIRDGAAIYGYWMQTNGERFRHFEAESLFHGRFKGQVLYNRPGRKKLLRRIADRGMRWMGFDKRAAPPSRTG